jgi:hypothetical protein
MMESRDVREKNKEGHHVGLDFYDLLIEALKTLAGEFRVKSGSCNSSGGNSRERSVWKSTLQRDKLNLRKQARTQGGNQ